jgi:hypothetical protein
MQFAGGHQEGAVAAEADDFGQHTTLVAEVVGLDLADRAHRHADACGFQHQAGHAQQRAHRFQRLRHGGVLLQVGQVAQPALVARGQALGQGGLHGHQRSGCVCTAACSPAWLPACKASSCPMLAAACAQRSAMRASMAPTSLCTNTPPRSTLVSASSRGAARGQRFFGAFGHQRQVLRVDVHGDVAGAEHHRVDGFTGHV